jgi:hypothetical protein
MQPLIEKHEKENRRLESTGLGTPSETPGLMGTGPTFARQDAADWAFGWFWNRTDPFFLSERGPRAGYPDPLLTLIIIVVGLLWQ